MSLIEKPKWLWLGIVLTALDAGTCLSSEPISVSRAVNDVYKTHGLIYRSSSSQTSSHGPVWTDAELPADYLINDRHLIIYAEGSGDQVKHFYHSISLLLNSELAVELGDQIAAAVVHWSKSTKVVTEHLSGKNQQEGALALQNMVITHNQRWGDAGSCTLIGFSAGTRVIQQAFGVEGVTDKDGNVKPALPRPPDMDHVTHIVYLGSSMLRQQAIPYDQIRGQFINFQNHRDTHYGDAAPYAAPAGNAPDISKGAETIFFKKRPKVGASANGFIQIPTVSAKGTWTDAEGRKMATPTIWPKKCNFLVPKNLIPLGVGQIPLPLPTLFDSMDDFWNNAQNHYIMMGRGPKGAIDSVSYRWYRNRARNFVQTEVAEAVLTGAIQSRK